MIVGDGSDLVFCGGLQLMDSLRGVVCCCSEGNYDGIQLMGAEILIVDMNAFL